MRTSTVHIPLLGRRVEDAVRDFEERSKGKVRAWSNSAGYLELTVDYDDPVNTEEVASDENDAPDS